MRGRFSGLIATLKLYTRRHFSQYAEFTYREIELTLLNFTSFSLITQMAEYQKTETIYHTLFVIRTFCLALSFASSYKTNE